MTSKRISEQVNTIRVATEKASVSPEAALAFLRKAGILASAPADVPPVALRQVTN